MRRFLVLGTIVLFGSAAIGLSAYREGAQQPEAPRVVQVEKLKDNLFVLKGGGGNTAVFVTAAGVVIVDTKLPGWGQPLISKIQELTSKPITTIINTHTHFDHVSGNVEFPTTVEVVVHENTKANMEQMRPPTGFPASANIFTENGGKGLPKRTYKDRMSIGSGNDQIDLYYFGRAHTNGDTWVVFPLHRVMHAGDVFAGKNLPLLDTNNGGSGVAIGDTIAKAAEIKNVDTIITGHSTQMTLQELREFGEFNRDFMKTVQDGKRAGRTVADMAASWKAPARFTGYGQPKPETVRQNMQVIYDELR